MTLNQYMHPRNPYSKRRPDFKTLAERYEEFKAHTTQGKNGNYHLDFKKPECLRSLSWALLKDDFGLDVKMPLDRLIPTIPLRLNYILWIEDLLDKKTSDVKGIDIGCGASCVYPLIGAKKNNWRFVATEKDGNNFSYAENNVKKNNLQEKIKVTKVDEGTVLLGDAINEDEFDFVMCNPPFFGSNMEAWGMAPNHRENRPDPMSVSTASPVESIIPGGEVNFVKHLIAESINLKTKIRVYTTMLGKKASLPVLKEELKQAGIANVGTTQFCQGRTMRWGLGWSFHEDVTFTKATIKAKGKKNKPLTHKFISEENFESSCENVLDIIKDLKLSYITTDTKPDTLISWEVTAIQNSWSHQRRKRRAERRAQEESPDKLRKPDADAQEGHTDTTFDTTTSDGSHKKEAGNSADNTDGSGTLCENTGNLSIYSDKSSDGQGGSGDTAADGGTTDYLFRCTTSVRKESGGYLLEMHWIDGQMKESMHQLMQYFINKLSPPKPVSS